MAKKKSHIKMPLATIDVVKGEKRFVHYDSLMSFMDSAKGTHFCAKSKDNLKRNTEKTKEFLDEESNLKWRIGQHFVDMKLTPKDIMEATTHPDIEHYEMELDKFNTSHLEGFRAKRPKRRRRFTEDAGDFDFERSIESDFCMVDWRKERFVDSETSGFIDIISEIGGNCDLSNEQLENGGLASCALSDALETMGYRVRIIGVEFCQGADLGSDSASKRDAVSITMKNYNEPLDSNKIGFALATGAFFRTVCFNHITRLCNGNISYTLGSAEDLSVKKLLEMPIDFSENRLILPRMKSREQAVKFVFDSIEAYKKKSQELAGSR